ncbi:MAG: 50S ribosomal protein L21 [Ignavibacteria bacterium]|jgi:large subunit ribosomal protein L21|nr:50S ribosomal protein L21 [Ignavibacteria bacterium]
MNALVEISGQQYEVAPNKKINVPFLSGEPGQHLEFSNILLTTDGDNITLGQPYINGKVSATILEHGRNKKTLVFHKKRRKGYQKLNGYRSKFTRIQIDSVE